MCGYADELLYLLFRIMAKNMVEDGEGLNERGSFSAATSVFNREHGILKDIIKETDIKSYKTSRAKSVSTRTVKAPEFGPQGILRYVVPYTVFLKIKDLNHGILPEYMGFVAQSTKTISKNKIT